MKRLFLLLLIMSVTLVFIGCKCQHKNIEVATCENESTCKNCNQILAPKLEHDYVIENTVAATCQEKGTLTYSCLLCHDTYSTNTYFGDHIGDETILLEPTVLEYGEKEINCTTCGQLIKIPLSPLSISPDHPIVLTVDKILDATEKDLEQAKKTYQYRWVQITGKVASVVHNDIEQLERISYGKKVKYTAGEVQYTINGIEIKSALIYWLAENKRFDRADVVVEMDTSLCINPETKSYTYFPQHSTVEVIAYCKSISESDIVLIDGRYPNK